MNRAWVFLHEASKFGRKGGIVPGVRALTAAVEIAAELAEREIEAGRISSPDFYSKEIQRYEHSSLGSSRII